MHDHQVLHGLDPGDLGLDHPLPGLGDIVRARGDVVRAAARVPLDELPGVAVAHHRDAGDPGGDLQAPLVGFALPPRALPALVLFFPTRRALLPAVFTPRLEPHDGTPSPSRMLALILTSAVMGGERFT